MPYSLPTGGIAVFHAARCQFSIDGTVIGWATGVSWSETINYEGVRVLDELAVAEHVPTTYDVTLSCRLLKISGASLKSQGIFPKYADILTKGTMTAQVLDSVAENGKGIGICNFTDVRASSYNITADAGGVVGKDVTFVCRKADDPQST